MNWKRFVQSVRGGLLREDHVCPWWLAYTFDNPLRRLLHDPDRLLAPFVRPGMTVADVGCGMGYFTVPLARLVGEHGAVLAVDLQQKMLERVLRRAEKNGVAGRIRRVLASKDNVGIEQQLDFVLAFWMVHETGDIRNFLDRLHSVIKPGGKILIAEPRMHVTGRAFQQTLEIARQAGFKVTGGPSIRISRSALLARA